MAETRLESLNNWLGRHTYLIEVLRICALIGAVVIGYWLFTSPHTVSHIQCDMMQDTISGLKDGKYCLFDAPCDKYIISPQQQFMDNLSALFPEKNNSKT